jgi:inner membrane protein
MAIAGSICAVFNPALVPAAVLGSTAPDWFEPLKRNLLRQHKVKHRGSTHYLAGWVLAMLLAIFVWDYQGILFWFAFGGAVHWACDAVTVTGAPVGWWSDNNITLFGGKIKTGHSTEYMVTGIVVAICALLIWHRSSTPGGFIPFFYDWPGFFRTGLLDGLEWRDNRFRIF